MPINGVEYAWSNMTVTCMGRAFERILDITYNAKVTKKQIYGRGSKVKGIQRGNEQPEGSITLGQSEVESLIATAQLTNPLAKLTDLTFDIQVHYLDASGNLIKDRIVGAEFTEAPKGMKQGDTDMEIKLPFMCEDILYNMP